MHKEIYFTMVQEFREYIIAYTYINPTSSDFISRTLSLISHNCKVLYVYALDTRVYPWVILQGQKNCFCCQTTAPDIPSENIYKPVMELGKVLIKTAYSKASNTVYNLPLELKKETMIVA